MHAPCWPMVGFCHCTRIAHSSHAGYCHSAARAWKEQRPGIRSQHVRAMPAHAPAHRRRPPFIPDTPFIIRQGSIAVRALQLGATTAHHPRVVAVARQPSHPLRARELIDGVPQAGWRGAGTLATTLRARPRRAHTKHKHTQAAAAQHDMQPPSQPARGPIVSNPPMAQAATRVH